jgi:hypothetical protein
MARIHELGLKRPPTTAPMNEYTRKKLNNPRAATPPTSKRTWANKKILMKKLGLITYK